jgi:hypothetical protein
VAPRPVLQDRRGSRDELFAGQPTEVTLVLGLTDSGEISRHDLPDPGPTTHMRGPTSALFLAFWHRRDPVAFHVSGDRTPLEIRPHI